jgi:hypothetical protein
MPGLTYRVDAQMQTQRVREERAAASEERYAERREILRRDERSQRSQRQIRPE